MSSSTLRSRRTLFALVLTILSLGFVSAHANNAYAEKSRERVKSLTVDVAENPFRFSFDRAGPLLEDGTPAYGNPFVTQGYIYPKGTLRRDDNVRGVCHGKRLVRTDWNLPGATKRPHSPGNDLDVKRRRSMTFSGDRRPGDTHGRQDLVQAIKH